jgi:hypothetical protein
MFVHDEGALHTMDPVNCSACGSVLTTVNYTIWGTKRFNPETKSYEEDDSLGNCDMEFSCPNCSRKLDPEGVDVILGEHSL